MSWPCLRSSQSRCKNATGLTMLDGGLEVKPPKINVKQTTPLEHKVQVTRGKKVVAERVVCLNRAELDAFILGCKLIEDILEKTKASK